MQKKKKNTVVKRGWLSVISELGFGFTAIIVVALLKIAWDGSDLGLRVERFVETELQRRLTDFNGERKLDAIVVDLKDLRQEFVDESTPRWGTPPAPLFKIISTIAASRPRAIAVDIDFSLERGTQKHPENPRFFEDCLALSEATKIPIFLGVYDAGNEEPAEWFGDEKYEKLGAGIVIPNRLFRIQTWRDAGHGRLQSLAFKLANALEPTTVPNAGKWSWLIEVEHMRYPKSHDGTRVGVSEMIIDAGTLHQLIAGTFFDASRLPSLVANRNKFEGKVVLLGDGYSSATDKIAMPGLPFPIESEDISPEAVPGVYVHACGALTPGRGYLWQFTHTGRVVIDAAIVTLILGFTILLKSLWLGLGKSGEWSDRFINQFLTVLSALIVVGFAYVFVRSFRTIWTDFPIVVMVLLLHRTCHHWIEKWLICFSGWFSRGIWSREK